MSWGKRGLFLASIQVLCHFAKENNKHYSVIHTTDSFLETSWNPSPKSYGPFGCMLEMSGSESEDTWTVALAVTIIDFMWMKNAGCLEHSFQQPHNAHLPASSWQISDTTRLSTCTMLEVGELMCLKDQEMPDGVVMPMIPTTCEAG